MFNCGVEISWVSSLLHETISLCRIQVVGGWGIDLLADAGEDKFVFTSVLQI